MSKFSKNAIYVRADGMHSVNFANLNTMKITDILLGFTAVTNSNYASTLATFLENCETNQIGVNLWTQALFMSGTWYNPTTTSGQNRISTYLEEIGNWIEIEGINGIHADYIRFPGNAYQFTGGTQAITDLMEDIYGVVKAENSNNQVSPALMPEKNVNAYYYGQDYAALSPFCDAQLPMIYMGNYNASREWATGVASYIEGQVDCGVWGCLQTYVSDSNVTPRSDTVLEGDAQAILNGGVEGLALFRHGLIADGSYSRIGNLVTPVRGPYSGYVEPTPEPITPKEIRPKSGCLNRIT